MAVHARGFSVQFSVLRALLVRDALMRYGHENLGFFWVILEPLMFAMGVAVMWLILNHGHGEVSTVAMALSGYILLTLFRHMIFSANRLLRRNLALRYHANVKPLDIFLAKALLETLGCLAAFFVAYLPLTVLGIIDPMRDSLLTMGAYALQAWFCISLALIMAALSEVSEVTEQVLPVVTYLILPLTGVFSLQVWMPAKVRDLLAWSPMVNIVEMFRAGMFSADITTYWDPWYVIWWCFAQTVLGLLAFDYVRRRVEMD